MKLKKFQKSGGIKKNTKKLIVDLLDEGFHKNTSEWKFQFARRAPHQGRWGKDNSKSHK